MSKSRIYSIYRKLYRYYGPQGWWPGRTRFEIIAGAILTQNTSWTNVEKAINALRKNSLLSPVKMRSVSSRKLSRLIRPAGYHNVKAKRLKSFIKFLFSEYSGSLGKMSRRPPGILRSELLGVNGIGPETCDSILLYAFNRPEFVIDAYTRRIFSRHNFFREDISYDDAKKYFTSKLPLEKKLYNEYHALIVRLAKDFCKARPACAACPIKMT